MMKRRKRQCARERVSLCVCLLALGWAAGASAAETSCRVVGSMKFDVGQTVCIPSARDTWLACTGATASSGGGAWKDTGVPCKEPQPKSAADYRPVPEGPHPAPAPAEVKRVIDQFRGIVFRCTPSAHISWSADACTRITEEFVSEAKAAGVAVVVVDPADDAAAKAQKTEVAGFKPEEAVAWSVRLTATDNGGAVFEETVDGVQELIPGIYDWKSLLIVSDAYLHPATAAHALDEAKTDFPGEIKYLTQ